MNISFVSKAYKPVKTVMAKAYSPFKNATANGLTKLANTNRMKRCADWGERLSFKRDIFGKNLNNFEGRLFPLVTLAYPIWLSGFYVVSNLTSKKIPKERKIPLAINDTIVVAFSTAVALTVQKTFEAFQAGLITRLSDVVKDKAKAKNLAGGIKQMVGIAAFTFVFRYLGPVIATPLADKVNNYLVKKGLIKDPNDQKDNNKENTVPFTSQNSTGQALDIVSADNLDLTPGFKNFLNHYNSTHSN